MPILTTKAKEYKSLLTDLTSLIQTAQQQAYDKINEIRLNTYWQMGQRMNQTKQTLATKDAETFAQNLAHDLTLDKTLVYRIMQFQEAYPKGAPLVDGIAISWAHHARLLSIKNESERLFYLDQATSNKWGRDTLRKAIKNNLYSSINTKGTTSKDLLKRDLNPLYIYKAIVEKVIDGDTLEVRIDLGFHTWTAQRIRLRGVNTGELTDKNKEAKMRAGKAKAFVQNLLANIPFIVVKTYKTDIYGRFIVDVFYHPTIIDKATVAVAGFFLNEDVVNSGHGVLQL